MRKKEGGQMAEIEATVAEKVMQLVICELASEQWVLVHCGEKA
jgi:hypothetical protein